MTEKIQEKIKQLIKDKNYKEIIKICSEILNTNEDEIAYFYRGIAKWNLYKYEESVKDFDRVLKLNPNNESAYYNRGMSKTDLGKYKGAIKDYDKIIELNSNNENAYLQRGYCKKCIKEYKGAIEDYDKVIELNPNNEDAYKQRGYCKNNIEKYKQAIDDFNMAIHINPDNKVAYNNRGLSKVKLNLYQESIEDYNEAINLDEEYLTAYYNRGLSKNYLGLYKEAIIDFNKFIELVKNYSFLKISDIISIFFYNKKITNIEYTFRQLIQADYNNLWKNDVIFNLLKHKIKNKDTSNNDNIFNNIKNILLYQYLLLKSLSFNINDNIEISYYTSLNTLLLLLNDKKEYKNKENDKNQKEERENIYNEGKMRMVNISNANDPKEGKILESIFNKNSLDIKISNNNEENLITLQTSYTRNKDSLTMFRLYGKNGKNEEATGICLVIDKKYFNDKFFSIPVQESIISTDYKNSNDNEEEQIENLKRDLFRMLYYNEKENKLIFNPNDSKYSNIIIDLKNIKSFKNKEGINNGKIASDNKKGITLKKIKER